MTAVKTWTAQNGSEITNDFQNRKSLPAGKLEMNLSTRFVQTHYDVPQVNRKIILPTQTIAASSRRHPRPQTRRRIFLSSKELREDEAEATSSSLLESSPSTSSFWTRLDPRWRRIKAKASSMQRATRNTLTPIHIFLMKSTKCIRNKTSKHCFQLIINNFFALRYLIPTGT